jgi:hypothetical protein
MITTLVLGGYSLTSSIIFLKYLQRFIRDSTTANSDQSSWLVLILASLLWPISLPLSALERNVQKNKSSFYHSEDREDKNHLELSNIIKPEKIEV